MNNQIVLHGQMNQQLASASHSFVGSGCSQSILSTFDKSVMEQTRSNDLKALEIGLIRKVTAERITVGFKPLCKYAREDKGIYGHFKGFFQR